MVIFAVPFEAFRQLQPLLTVKTDVWDQPCLEENSLTRK